MCNARHVVAASVGAIAMVGCLRGARATSRAASSTSPCGRSACSGLGDNAGDDDREPVGRPDRLRLRGYAAQNPTGPGSVAGMAQDPVTVAASNNPHADHPDLGVVRQAQPAGEPGRHPQQRPVHGIRSDQCTRSASSPAATLDKLKTDAPLLNSILTYHVVSGQLSPRQGRRPAPAPCRVAALTVTGSGNDLKVNDAGLVCGGVSHR